MYVSIKGEIEVIIALPSKIEIDENTEYLWLTENFGNYVSLDKLSWPKSPDHAIENIEKFMK